MRRNVTGSYTPRHSAGRVSMVTPVHRLAGAFYDALMPDADSRPLSPTSDVPPRGRHRAPVTRWGEAVMHRPARPVTVYDDELRRLVADMSATMYAANGVGLAACQVGVDLAVFVFDCPDEDGNIHRGVVCNPVMELPEGPERRWTRTTRAACPIPAPSWSARGPTARG